MAARFVALSCLVAMASAVAVPVGVQVGLPVAKVAVPVAKVAYQPEYPDAPAHYQYAYSVADQHTGDIKEQKEDRNGDAVQGYYSLVQPDGVQRIVEYTSDAVHGFNAVVRYEGQPHAVKVAAPVAKVLAPAPISYAPVAKVAVAPVAKVAYAPAPVHYQQPAPAIHYAQPAPAIHYAQPAPAYVAPAVAKVAYQAPLAYASAPVVAKVAAPAYSQNLGHVSFSSPVVSYQH